MCGPVRAAEWKQDSMAVSFFGGPDGAGARVWSAGRIVADQQDQEQLRARIRELEALCTDVLVAGVDLGLPQHLLNQLWGAVGHGELPHAFNVDLPPAPPRPVAGRAGSRIGHRHRDAASTAGRLSRRPCRPVRRSRFPTSR